MMDSPAITDVDQSRAAWYYERVLRDPRLNISLSAQRSIGSNLHAGLIAPQLVADRQRHAREQLFGLLEQLDPDLEYIISIWTQFRVEVVEVASRRRDWSSFFDHLDSTSRQWLTNRRHCRVPLSFDELGEFVDLVTVIRCREASLESINA